MCTTLADPVIAAASRASASVLPTPAAPGCGRPTPATSMQEPSAWASLAVSSRCCDCGGSASLVIQNDQPSAPSTSWPCRPRRESSTRRRSVWAASRMPGVGGFGVA